MATHTLPGIGLTGGFVTGEDGWGAAMDANLLKLSVLTQGGVDDMVAAVPGSPPAGYAVILTAAPHEDNIAVYDEGAWVYFEPVLGWLVCNRDTGDYFSFNGSAWVAFSSGGGGGGGVEEAPEDGTPYARQDAAWVSVTSGGGGGSGSSVFGVLDATTQTVLKQSGCTITFPGGGSGTHYSVAFDTPRDDANYAVLFGGVDQGTQFGDSGYLVDGTITTDGFDIVAHSNSETERQIKRLSFLVVDQDTGGGGATGDIQSMIRKAMVDNATTLVSGSNVTFTVELGDEVALCQFLYTSSGAFVDGVSYTVPTGKIAYITFFDYNTNTKSDPTFYKIRCYNDTTASSPIDSAVGANAGTDGTVYPDNANAPTPFPKVAGVAGDVIKIQGRSAGDGNYRTVNGYFILTLGDA